MWSSDRLIGKVRYIGRRLWAIGHVITAAKRSRGQAEFGNFRANRLAQPWRAQRTEDKDSWTRRIVSSSILLSIQMTLYGRAATKMRVGLPAI
jgi:hypothetical protein